MLDEVSDQIRAWLDRERDLGPRGPATPEGGNAGQVHR
jgi:hypothetical protein